MEGLILTMVAVFGWTAAQESLRKVTKRDTSVAIPSQELIQLETEEEIF